MATLEAIKKHVRRLEAVYSLPTDRDAVIASWLGVLGDVTDAELGAAVERYTRLHSQPRLGGH